ncbi:MAG: 50S ribosomal protein L29 [Candidatus Latescibacteria bacterium]|jgi:large subunit ribosomal protein L29|nr:50S ribosomal protein L29 [Candidatus Latescibacterota bacterium]
MKSYELRELTETELVDRVAELNEEIYNLRFQKATRQSSDTKRMSSLRREIAQIHTIVRENELGIRTLGASTEAKGADVGEKSGDDA